MVLADAIFPAFYAPYVAAVMVPWAGLGALVTEIMIFLLMYSVPGRVWLAFTIVVANVASSSIGIGLAMLLPSDLNDRFLAAGGGPGLGPQWSTLATAVWVVAFAVSVAVEFLVLVLVTRSLKLKRLFRTVMLANLASYAVLLGTLKVTSLWVWR